MSDDFKVGDEVYCECAISSNKVATIVKIKYDSHYSKKVLLCLLELKDEERKWMGPFLLKKFESPGFKVDDMVFANIDGAHRVARIYKIIDDKAHVKFKESAIVNLSSLKKKPENINYGDDENV